VSVEPTCSAIHRHELSLRTYHMSNLTLGQLSTTQTKNCFLLVRTMAQVNFSKLLELSETSRARKLIFRLQVNIYKAKSRRYDVSLRRYMGPSKDPHISLL